MVEENQTPQVGAAVQNVRTVANPGGVEEIFADGISSVFSRGGVIKLDLFSVVGFDLENKTEERRVSHRLVVPVSAAPEFLRAFQTLTQAVQQAAKVGKAAESEAGSAGDVTLP